MDFMFHLSYLREGICNTFLRYYLPIIIVKVVNLYLVFAFK